MWHLYYGHIRFEYFHMIKHWKSLPSHWTHNLMPNHSNVFYEHRKNSFASLCAISQNMGLVFNIFIRSIYSDLINTVYFTNLKIDKHNGYVLYWIIVYKEYLTNGLLLKDLENGLLYYQESFSMTLVEKR